MCLVLHCNNAMDVRKDDHVVQQILVLSVLYNKIYILQYFSFIFTSYN